MKDATRRPLSAQPPSQLSRPIAKIDRIDGWRGRWLYAGPIARSASALAVALARFKLAHFNLGKLYSHRDEDAATEDAATILINAKRVGFITRWQWKIGAHNGVIGSTLLPSPCHPGKQ